jgi:hypothetical protein
MVVTSVTLAQLPARIASKSEDFPKALLADGPAADLPQSAVSVYDWLVGDWEVEVTDVEPDGSSYHSTGEWHFAWVLEGRAVQDVWVDPKLAQRSSSSPHQHNRYGTTLRYYDSSVKAWRAIWINPVTGDKTELVGRKVGDSIVLQSADQDVDFVRWTFTDIKPRSFTWRGEYSRDGGKTWQLGAEFHARRAQLSAP